MARQSAQPDPPPDRGHSLGFGKTTLGDLLWDLLTFDRLVTGPIVHILYWAGLAILLVLGCASVGAAVGAALREDGLNAWLLSFGFVVLGLLFISAAALIWRGVCEFYVAVFRISDDLRIIRARMEGADPFPDVAEETAKAAPRPRKPKTAAATPSSPDALKFE